jgi:hypothetical protein
MLTTEPPFCWYTLTAGFCAPGAAGWADWALAAEAAVSPAPAAEGDALVLTALGEAAAGAVVEVDAGGTAVGWLVWTEHATNRRAVVAALVTATSAVWINRGTPVG